MKKMTAIVLCLVLALLLAGCGSDKEKKSGDTTVKIDGIVYVNTGKAVSVDPDKAVIVKAELPLNGSLTEEKITAYAFIGEETPEDTLVCLIDGKWYQFAETDRAGQP